jgi:hypothetical protein
MFSDVRSVCLSLVRSGTGVRLAPRSPRPLALGWKIESGMLPPAEVEALFRSVRDALATIEPSRRRWVASEPLRALLIEYGAVRRGAKRAWRAYPAKRGRRVSRPADCA